MIALVSGSVVVRRPDHVVVECAGVGYRLAVSAETLKHVPAAGNQVTLHAHLVVRDDALALYGFATEEERELFLMLLGVQSVGPKVALAVLSGGPPRELLAALAAGDSARLQAVPGIGKRTAERIIVELREKVGASLPEQAITIVRADDPRSVAREGLLGLGYSPSEADELLDGATGERPEELIAQALKSRMTRSTAFQASPDGELRR
jgi:Holliday junction DNA helicase RuvA